MGHSTEATYVKKSKKSHICSWCGTEIKAGQPYSRWRWFDDGYTSAVKIHPECDEALIEMSDGDVIEFRQGDNPRGCNCDWDRGCERCKATTNLGDF